MIKMEQNLQEMKEAFFSACKEKKILTRNRAALLCHLSVRLEEEPEDEQIRQLLLLALADYGVISGHFWESDAMEAEEDYQEVKRKYLKLEEDYKLQRHLSLQWKEVRGAYDNLPGLKAHEDTDGTVYTEETDKAVHLYRKFMGVSEKDSPELYNNLHRFICMAKKTEEYRLIMPLFLFQLMVRHTGRLAVKENLNVSLKSLWGYKEYQITKDNGKNFKRYQLYVMLFWKLCRAYHRGDASVNLELCRYGLGATSNLVEWVMDIQHYRFPLKIPKRKKTMTPICIDLLRADMSITECYEPEIYSINEIFGFSQKEEWKYMEDFWDDYEEVDEAVKEYILEHVDYIFLWMEHLYVDIGPLQEYVEEIYKECIPKLPKKKAWMEKCIKGQIYETIQNMLEEFMWEKVVSVVAWHGEGKVE